MLFAVLVSSLLLSIGVAILDLTLKEFSLSSAGKASQFAFYAADDAMECALYWEHNNDLSKGSSSFATSSESHEYSGFLCHGNAIYQTGNLDVIGAVSVRDPHNPAVPVIATTDFWLTYGPGPNLKAPCAHVQIKKITRAGLVQTIIESRGYDTCDDTNPHRTERGLQALF